MGRAKKEKVPLLPMSHSWEEHGTMETWVPALALPLTPSLTLGNSLVLVCLSFPVSKLTTAENHWTGEEGGGIGNLSARRQVGGGLGAGLRQGESREQWL